MDWLDADPFFYVLKKDLMYNYNMKEQIKQFCQGIYDSMQTSPEFINKYSLDDLYKIVLNAFSMVALKVFTLIMGIIACILASIQFQLEFSTLFWVGLTLWLCWVVSDDALKKLVELIKDIQSMNK